MLLLLVSSSLQPHCTRMALLTSDLGLPRQEPPPGTVDITITVTETVTAPAPVITTGGVQLDCFPNGC